MNGKDASPNRSLAVMAGAFLAVYLLPMDAPRVEAAIREAVFLLSEYAREHVLFCLVPAMFISGAITVFLNRQAVVRYLGPAAPKLLAYSMASVSGSILAVCSCTVLPLFKGIYKKGAGLGPAVSFLYSGPAINVLAIVLSFRVFGWKLGLARMAGAVVFAFLIGLVMQALFRREDDERLADGRMFRYDGGEGKEDLGRMALLLLSLTGILVFLNWAPSRGAVRAWDVIYTNKFLITAAFGALLAFCLMFRYSRDELRDWVGATRDMSLQMLPYLFGGVMAAGFLLGRPGHEALIPAPWVAGLLGGDSLRANFFASAAGAFMYFATLTEVPIVQGLMGSGMGTGPALALLLAGPSLSLPSMVVIHTELGFRKTAAYVALVIGLSTFLGFLFGLVA